MFFDSNFQQTETIKMDPIFYSPTNGLPSESKLATYMVTPQSPEFIPARLTSSPSFFSPYASLLNGTGGSSVVGSGSSTGSVASGGSGTIANGGGATAAVGGVIGNGSGNHISSTVKSNNVPGTPILGLNTYSATPIKVGRNLLRGESPLSNGDSPKQTPQSSPPPPTPSQSTTTTVVPAGIHQENVGGTTYFYPASATNHTANSANSSDVGLGSHNNSQQSHSFTHPHVTHTNHVYSGPSSNVVNMQSRTQLSSAFFLPDGMRHEIQQRNEIANMVDTNPNSDLPQKIDNYHSLYPLETQPLHPKLPLPSSTYKANNINTGIKYCLRRLHGFRLQSVKCMTVIEMWKKLQHSNVVQLREVFTTKGFGDHSFVLVYDYFPGSQTLLSKYFTPISESNGYTDPFQGDARPFSHKSSLQQRTPNGPLLHESEIWAIVMQLTAGLRAIHQAGLACRTLDPTKIIVTGKRVRFSFSGISDIVYFDPNQPNPLVAASNYQQEDLTALGKLVLSLACRSFHAVQEDQLQTSIALVTRNYSSDLRNLILYLLTSSSTRRSVTDLMPMIGARFYTQLDALQNECDMQEDCLAKEMENGRLYRILVKLGSINERPELSMDVTWSETGDRYMLKLFRDYLFHMVTEDGRPWLDHAHILQCLNKLDAGTLEKVNLMSRDEQSVLVVTYAELKHCLEQAFSELTADV